MTQSISIGPSGPHFELIYPVSIGYEGRIAIRFTIVYKGLLAIT